MNVLPKKILKAGKKLIQKLIMTTELYNINGLANHAAAGAYGFLLSLAPMVLIIVFSILYFFMPSQQEISALIGNISFLSELIDESQLTQSILSISTHNISGIISILSILWATRILALSIRRGLIVIFPAKKKRNPIMNTVIIIAIDAVILLCILTAIVSSRTALYFYNLFDFIPRVTQMDNLIPIIFLGFVSFLAYLLIPVNSPRRFSALQGAILCSVAYGITAAVLSYFMDKTRINFLYGTLGNMIFMLINVYFFFSFFFLGAEFAFVTDFFDALFFSKLRQIRIKSKLKNKQKKSIINLPSRASSKLFAAESNLDKYLHSYKKKEIIVNKGDTGEEIFYLLEGEVEILLSSTPQDNSPANVLQADSFFGEMGYLLSEERSATIRAKTDVSVLMLPPSLFETILKHDKNLDRDIIEHMSRRIKSTNEHLRNLIEDL